MNATILRRRAESLGPASRRALVAAGVVASVLVAATAGVPSAGAAGTSTTTTSPTTTAAVPPPGGPPTTVPGQRAVAEQQVDVLSASRDDVRAQVAGIDRRLADQEARLAFSQLAVEQARATSTAARAKAAAAAEAARAAHDDVRDYAVEAFIRPPAQDALSVLAISKVDEAGYASKVLEILADERGKVVDVMAQAEATATKEQDQADAAAQEAQAQADQAQGQVDALQSVRADQVQLASSLDGRLDAALSEASALKAIDAKAAKELADQETALRASAPPTPAVAPKVAAATTAAPAAGRPVAAGAPPTTSAPRAPTATTPPPTTTPAPPSGLVTWADVVKVGGIWVNQRIAEPVRSLLNAATAAGFSLSGGGFRDPASQIALRQAHCGTSSYAIYQMPASQCTPPTARPGTSMHEQGLAIDFMSSGRLISTRSDPAFQWLAANASRFGFYNLPSEPWHWSVNGS